MVVWKFGNGTLKKHGKIFVGILVSNYCVLGCPAGSDRN